jgi:hypothetical protein
MPLLPPWMQCEDSLILANGFVLGLNYQVSKASPHPSDEDLSPGTPCRRGPRETWAARPLGSGCKVRIKAGLERFWARYWRGFEAHFEAEATGPGPVINAPHSEASG